MATATEKKQDVKSEPKQTAFGIDLTETNVYVKIAAAKMEIGAIAKKEDNPFFKSKYFDINALLHHCEPILFKYRLLAMQPIRDGFVVSRIINIDKIDDVDETSWKIPENITDPQKVGSAITYFRRYLLQAQLGLQAEDDDGNKAGLASKSGKNQVDPIALAAKDISDSKTMEEFNSKCKKYSQHQKDKRILNAAVNTKKRLQGAAKENTKPKEEEKKQPAKPEAKNTAVPDDKLAKREASIKKIIAAIDGIDSPEKYAEVDGKIPDSFKKVDKISRALAAKNAKVNSKK